MLNGGMTISKTLFFIFLFVALVTISTYVFFSFDFWYHLITTGNIFYECTGLGTIQKYAESLDRKILYNIENDCYYLEDQI